MVLASKKKANSKPTCIFCGKKAIKLDIPKKVRERLWSIFECQCIIFEGEFSPFFGYRKFITKDMETCRLELFIPNATHLDSLHWIIVNYTTKIGSVGTHIYNCSKVRSYTREYYSIKLYDTLSFNSVKHFLNMNLKDIQSWIRAVMLFR